MWSRLQAQLRHAVPETTFDVWIAPLQPAALEGTVLVLHAPAEIHSWVKARYGDLLTRTAAAALTPHVTRVEVRLPSEQPAQAQAQAAAPVPLAEPTLNPKFTFEHYVIGDANRFAHAAALAVAELPGQAYNPLFIYGPPGVGKTHLLQSIGNYVNTYGSGLTVRYTTVERFTNEFLAALHRGDIEHFKGRYRHNDVLLIDDVQFLERKLKTEEEFFHTFNALHDTGSQVVLTCDRLPADMAALEERLRDRFGSGLVVDIRPPDRATRLAVLRKRVQHDGVALDGDGVLEVLADRVTTNIRALEGALIRVVAYSSLRGEPLTARLAEHVLDGLYGPARRGPARAVVTVDHIQAAVADSFGLTRDELLSQSRAARISWPRQIAMYLSREHTQETLPAIGRRFGGRDHSTVLHAYRRTADRMARDPDAYEVVRALTERLATTDADRSR